MEKVYSQESFGDSGHVKVEVQLDIGRPLTDNDNWAISQGMAKILGDIRAETNKLNPKRQNNIRSEKLAILDLFDNPIYVEEIPNGYCSDWCCRDKPWFAVTTKVGRIKIGGLAGVSRRKSVINIDWSESTVNVPAETMFASEDVTKIERAIHAWGYDKAREYLKKIIG